MKTTATTERSRAGLVQLEEAQRSWREGPPVESVLRGEVVVRREGEASEVPALWTLVIQSGPHSTAAASEAAAILRSAVEGQGEAAVDGARTGCLSVGKCGCGLRSLFGRHGKRCVLRGRGEGGATMPTGWEGAYSRPPTSSPVPAGGARSVLVRTDHLPEKQLVEKHPDDRRPTATAPRRRRGLTVSLAPPPPSPSPFDDASSELMRSSESIEAGEFVTAARNPLRLSREGAEGPDSPRPSTARRRHPTPPRHRRVRYESAEEVGWYESVEALRRAARERRARRGRSELELAVEGGEEDSARGAAHLARTSHHPDLRALEADYENLQRSPPKPETRAVRQSVRASTVQAVESEEVREAGRAAHLARAARQAVRVSTVLEVESEASGGEGEAVPSSTRTRRDLGAHQAPRGAADESRESEELTAASSTSSRVHQAHRGSTTREVESEVERRTQTSSRVHQAQRGSTTTPSWVVGGETVEVASGVSRAHQAHQAQRGSTTQATQSEASEASEARGRAAHPAPPVHQAQRGTTTQATQSEARAPSCRVIDELSILKAGHCRRDSPGALELAATASRDLIDAESDEAVAITYGCDKCRAALGRPMFHPSRIPAPKTAGTGSATTRRSSRDDLVAARTAFKAALELAIKRRLLDTQGRLMCPLCLYPLESR